MNKYLFILTVAVLATWSIFKYLDYTKFDNISDYSYSIHEEIDIHYHKTSLVKQYYEDIYRSSSFAREQWYNYEIDVRTPDHKNPQSILANQTYDLMLSNISYAEKILINSKKLKDLGFNNTAIKQMESSGKDPESYKRSLKFSRTEIALGDKGKDVEAVQLRLVELGYEIPITGLFSKMTESYIIDFQIKNKLFPTGVIDQETLQLLIIN